MPPPLLYSAMRNQPFTCFCLTRVSALFLIGLAGVDAFAADRVALVIGNSAYEHSSPLSNPVSDAIDISDALTRCGFSLVGGTAQTNLKNEAMSAILEEFRQAASTSKVALFFFAGHGLEVQGLNYLVPVDAKASEEYEVKHRTLALDHVLGAMAGEDRLKIVILDCCRNNPLGSGWERTGEEGLAAPQSTPGGTILLFAAAPGKVASDGRGRNSPFSGVLKSELVKPAVEIETVFKRVGNLVKKATGKQEPWMNSSFYGTFSFMTDAETVIPREKPPGPVKATKEAPFVNTLGMRFVPNLSDSGGKKTWINIWETRVKDFASFAETDSSVGIEWRSCEYAGHPQTPDHPVLMVSWKDANAFCVWLTAHERVEGGIGLDYEYRLPTDQEWSLAVGLGKKEDPAASIQEKSAVRIYPWGDDWPPPPGAGNFCGQECYEKIKIEGYNDDHPFTASVGSYPANERGLYDLVGNVWEWCADPFPGLSADARIVRCGSWRDPVEFGYRSSARVGKPATEKSLYIGFRVVLSETR